MKKVATLLTTLIIIISTHTLSAQRHQEVGLSFTSFDLQTTSLLYKKERKIPNQYMRYNLLYSSINYNYINRGNTTVSPTNQSASIGIGIGKEKREVISTKLAFLHGLGGTLSTHWSRENADIATVNLFSLNGSIHYLLGLRYELGQGFAIGIELTPSIQASTSWAKNKNNNNNNTRLYWSGVRASANASNSFLSFVATYNFTTKKS